MIVPHDLQFTFQNPPHMVFAFRGHVPPSSRVQAAKVRCASNLFSLIIIHQILQEIPSARMIAYNSGYSRKEKFQVLQGFTDSATPRI